MSPPKDVNPSLLQADTFVGPYRIIEKVGSGGFGCVYKVDREGTVFALKIALRRFAEVEGLDRDHLEGRFEREVASLMSLRHPNVIRVHSHERWPDFRTGYPYLVMDYVEGENLASWRASTGPTARAICLLFEKLASAVAQIHRVGICHRDLKAQNVIVRDDGEPVIVDFGIARPWGAPDITLAGEVGTPPNYPPEYVTYLDSQESRNGPAFPWGAPVDIYGLGNLLYEALVGEGPFDALWDPEHSDDSKTFSAIRMDTPKAPSVANPRVPKALDGIVLQLLAKNPDERPKTGYVLAALLAKAREDGEGGAEECWTKPVCDPEEDDEEEAQGEAGEEEEAREEWGISPPASPPPPTVQAAPPKPSPAAAVELPAPERPAINFPEEERGSGSPQVGAAERGGQEPARDVWAEIEASAPRRKVNPYVVGGGIAIVLLLLLLIVVARGAPEQRRPEVLFSSGEKRGWASLSGEARAAHDAPLGPAIPSMLRPAETLPGDAPTASNGSSAKGPGAIPGPNRVAPLGSSAADKKRLHGKPAVDPGLHADASPPWLLRSRKIDPQPGKGAASASHGVPLGAHIRVKLITSLDSRTVGSGPVEASLAGPLVLRGRELLPAGTFAYGAASEAGGRFTVRFTRLRLPDDTEIPFEGIAMTREDGRPGLSASSRITREGTRGEGILGRAARSAGGILLDSFTSGPAQAIARSAGESLFSNDERGTHGTEETALLESGGVFDIWVAKAF